MNQKDKDRIEFLRFTPYDTYTLADINFLERMYIINGVGPEAYGWLFRYLMTWLFSFIDYKRHDVSWWKGEDFHHSNRGLLKYSYLSLAKEYKQICKQKLCKRILLKTKHFITLPFKTIIIDLAYDAVESELGKKAYLTCKGL